MSEGTGRRVTGVALGLAAVAVGLIACGDDGDKAPSAKEVFCAAMTKIDEPFAEAGQYASRDQKIEAAKKVAGFLDATANVAPPDIADAAKTKFDAIRAASEGNTSPLIDSATLTAIQRIKDYCPA